MGEAPGDHLNQADIPVPAAVMTNKEKYRELKKRFKFLVYENEFYQEELRNLQRKLMKLSRDRNFLLDRLLMFQRPSDSSDESDSTIPKKIKRTRTRKRDQPKATGAVLTTNCRKARKSSVKETPVDVSSTAKEGVSDSPKEIALPKSDALITTQSLTGSEH
uniref:INO80 complex subunit E n=1 Tax=Trichuris muris TaxID=70415 RepID=A0A5S6QSJ8_TRIMR